MIVSAGRRISREAACDGLPDLGPSEAANALRRSLSLARLALSALGTEPAELLMADRGRLWVPGEPELKVDLEVHQAALRLALSLPPGFDRDEHLTEALRVEGTLLEDEPYADWALRPREALDALRREARLALARDRAAGLGHSTDDDVIGSWEACSKADPASQEAATALVQAHLARGHQALAGAVFRRRCESLEGLGIRVLARSRTGHDVRPQGEASRWPPTTFQCQRRAPPGERFFRRPRWSGRGRRISRPRGPA